MGQQRFIKTFSFFYLIFPLSSAQVTLTHIRSNKSLGERKKSLSLLFPSLCFRTMSKDNVNRINFLHAMPGVKVPNHKAFYSRDNGEKVRRIKNPEYVFRICHRAVRKISEAKLSLRALPHQKQTQ